MVTIKARSLVLPAVAFAAALAGGAVALARYFSTDSGLTRCSASPVATVSGPGERAATLYRLQCRKPLGSTLELSLLSSGQAPPVASGNAFSADGPTSGPAEAWKDWVRVAWRGQDTLIVTHRRELHFWHRATQVGGVMIAYEEMRDSGV
jgi:hypothetical protein